MPLFGPPNIEKMKAKGDINGLLKALSDQQGAVRCQAAEALGQLGDLRALEPLLDALKARDDQMRDAAVRGLGELHNAKAVKPLIAKLLYDSNYNVQISAAFALGKIGDPQAVEPLTAAIKNGSKVGFAADQALKKMPIAALIAAHKKTQIGAVALVCEANITFDSDEALNGFAKKALQSKWTEIESSYNVQIEMTTGFRRSEDEVKSRLKELLQRAVDTVGLQQGQYEVEHLSVQIQAPPS